LRAVSDRPLRKLLILLILQAWLAAHWTISATGWAGAAARERRRNSSVDDFRPWLIREAA